MKKYLAYSVGNGNSGIKTKEEAVKWAATILSCQARCEQVFICEAIEIHERTKPSVEVRPFTETEVPEKAVGQNILDSLAAS